MFTGRATLIMLVWFIAAWLLFLCFQHGHPWDESEHSHAAWLISNGKRPLEDFFQHHQPLLWSLLSIYFDAGFKGPGYCCGADSWLCAVG